MQVDILAAKNQLSQLIKRAHAGEEIVIANRGQPVARLVAHPWPVDGQELRTNGILGWLATHPLPVHAKRNTAEIDAAISNERIAWD